MTIETKDWYDRNGKKLELGDKVKLFYPKSMADPIEVDFIFENGALGFGSDQEISYDLLATMAQSEDYEWIGVACEHFITINEILWNFDGIEGTRIPIIEKVVNNG